MDNITECSALTKATLANLPILVRFMIGLTLFLLVPGISERFKIPGMVGLILVGLLGGPNGIDIWPDNPVIMTAFAEIGVLLVLFYAGLEIDLAVFQRVGGRAIAFGLATLLLPLSAGAGLGYLMGYDLNAAILIGSLIASHTLLGFPILQKLGLASREPVLVTISGTIFTDIVALLILAVCVQIHHTGFDKATLALEIIEVVAYAAIVLFVVSRIAGHLMRKYSGQPRYAYARAAAHHHRVLAAGRSDPSGADCRRLPRRRGSQPFAARHAGARAYRGDRQHHLRPGLLLHDRHEDQCSAKLCACCGTTRFSRQDWCSPCSAQNFWPPGAWVGCRAIPSSIVSTCGR